VSRDAFKDRLANALLRRLHPNTGLHRKVLSHAIGVHENTVDNWCAGYSQPDSYFMGELIQFFDAGFANEVYAAHGAVVAKLSDTRKARALQAVNKLAPALDALSEFAVA
jgi:hypothetical protein